LTFFQQSQVHGNNPNNMRCRRCGWCRIGVWEGRVSW